MSVLAGSNIQYGAPSPAGATLTVNALSPSASVSLLPWMITVQLLAPSGTLLHVPPTTETRSGASDAGPLEFGGLTRTEMGCAEQDQNLLEGRYFAALEAADSVSVSADGETLELTGDDLFVRFERSENREG